MMSANYLGAWVDLITVVFSAWKPLDTYRHGVIP